MSSILALDLGEKRVGVARADTVARLAQPLTTLANDETFTDKLQALIKEHNAKQLVVGLPRGMQGQFTQQTKAVEAMAADLQKLGLKIQWQDETLTSHQAEAELTRRRVSYNKEAVDALAACLILEDFLRGRPQP